MNWPIGGTLCLKLCFVYNSSPTDDPETGYNQSWKKLNQLAYKQMPSGDEILN